MRMINGDYIGLISGVCKDYVGIIIWELHTHSMGSIFPIPYSSLPKAMAGRGTDLVQSLQGTTPPRFRAQVFRVCGLVA